MNPWNYWHSQDSAKLILIAKKELEKVLGGVSGITDTYDEICFSEGAVTGFEVGVKGDVTYSLLDSVSRALKTTEIDVLTEAESGSSGGCDSCDFGAEPGEVNSRLSVGCNLPLTLPPPPTPRHIILVTGYPPESMEWTRRNTIQGWDKVINCTTPQQLFGLVEGWEVVFVGRWQRLPAIDSILKALRANGYDDIPK